MKQTNLNDLWVFVEVAQKQGFRSAASHLNLSVGAVSETIKRLENNLGVRLIERTTRKVSLTAAGEKLLNNSLPALKDLSHVFNDVSADQKTISGTLRLSAPHSSAAFFLNKAIAQYSETYPNVKIEVLYDDAKVDLVTSGIDATIRSKKLVQSGTYSIEVGPKIEMALVVSPKYLDSHPSPQKPTDLTQHDGIRFAFGNAEKLAPWTFVDQKNKRSYSVEPRSRLIVNDMKSMIHYAQAGLGFAYLYRRTAESFIQEGELITLFDASVPQLPRYTLNYLTKRHMPARLKAFIDVLKSLK